MPAVIASASDSPAPDGEAPLDRPQNGQNPPKRGSQRARGSSRGEAGSTAGARGGQGTQYHHTGEGPQPQQQPWGQERWHLPAVAVAGTSAGSQAAGKSEPARARPQADKRREMPHGARPAAVPSHVPQARQSPNTGSARPGAGTRAAAGCSQDARCTQPRDSRSAQLPWGRTPLPRHWHSP